jgi:hypothetical protein
MALLVFPAQGKTKGQRVAEPTLWLAPLPKAAALGFSCCCSGAAAGKRYGSATAGKREQSYCSRASLLEANKTLNKAQVTRLNRENDRLEIKGRLKIKLGYNI